jgi:hypothetical protein
VTTEIIAGKKTLDYLKKKLAKIMIAKISNSIARFINLLASAFCFFSDAVM